MFFLQPQVYKKYNLLKGKKKKRGWTSRERKQAGDITLIVPLSVARAVACNPPACVLESAGAHWIMQVLNALVLEFCTGLSETAKV